MKIYSDTLTTADLYAALPSDVGMNHRTLRNPRVRANGWEVHLHGYGARHTRKTNSGGWGAGDEHAATWDDHGLWMAKLYEKDPGAKIAHYNGRSDFYESTSRYQPRGMSAPWLRESAALAS